MPKLLPPAPSTPDAPKKKSGAKLLARKPVHDPDTELTPKQARFCQEYLLDMNAKQAALRAGYKPSVANKATERLLRHPNVFRHISKLQMSMTENLSLSAEWVLSTMKDQVLRHLQAAGHGPMSDSGVKVLEKLGKHLGLFKDTVDLNIPGQDLISAMKIEFVSANDGKPDQPTTH